MEEKENKHTCLEKSDSQNPVEDMDFNSDSECEIDVKLLKNIHDKHRYTKRDERMRKLMMESNYGTYSVPDIERIENETLFTKTNVLSIYYAAIILGHEKLAVLYISMLLVSRKYYHLVIKSPHLMNAIKTVMRSNLRIHTFIKYCMKYSFFMMMKEERMFGRKIKSNNRSIMSGDEFRALPIFDCELEKSPYFTEIYTHKNSPLRLNIRMYLHGKRRFTERKEFIWRLGVISGNMLNGINLSEHDAYLTGSSLVPCVVTNPLEDNFEQCTNSFESYVEYYYPSYKSINMYRVLFETAKKK